MALQELWFIIVTVLFLGFFILEGFRVPFVPAFGAGEGAGSGRVAVRAFALGAGFEFVGHMAVFSLGNRRAS